MPLSGGSSGQAVATSQLVTTTGNITTWGSIVTVTSASATTQTLPQCTLADIGKSITISNNGAGLVTTVAFGGDTLQNSRVLAQGEAITITVTAANLSRVISDSVAIPVITESLPSWTATTAVNASAERSTTILGVLTGLSSKTTRTTTATFNATEGANWNYLSQSSVPLFTASSLVLAGFQIVDSGQTFQSNTTRVTGLTFDTTEQLSWTALSSSATGTRVNLSNFAANTSIGTAAATVDSATIIAFVQTTANITVTIPSPTNVNVHKTISVENLTTSTQPITVKGFAGVTDTITLGVGDVKEISWNGNGWRATSPVNVLGEYGIINLVGESFTTNTFVSSTNGIYTIPSAGVWRLRYDISTDGSGVTVTNSMVAIFDASNNIVTGSERARGGSVTVAANLTAEVFVTTTSATTYTLRARIGAASGSFGIINNASFDSTISWEKISGYSAVTGQSVDTISVNLTASNQSIPVVNTDVIFNTVAFGNIPYNTSTGVFTLTLGKTYELEATLKSRGTTAGYIQYEWVDATSGVAISGGINGVDMHATSTLVEGNSTRAYLMYSPTTNQTVKVRVTGIAGTGLFLDTQRCNANIKQLGSTSFGTSTNLQVTSLTVSPTSTSLASGQTQLITPTILPVNATNQNLTWVSSSPSVATVSAAGLVNYVSAGSTTITAQTTDGSNKVAISTISAGLAVRILANSGGSNYTQLELQTAYNNQAGSNAPDTVPNDVIVYFNSFATTTYKVYLGHNQWWYTNTAAGSIVAGSFTMFGGSKSAFGANIQSIVSYK